jgi:predicted metal-dependent enzyme (double-stranded beta helix superfamily)
MTPDASAVLRELGLPSDRTLERPELERLATSLAERRNLWTPHLNASATERTYACLHRDAQLDIWAIFWLPENDTGWHDHDTSSGAVHVVAGELEEHALLVAAPERRTRYGAGAAFTFGPSHIHRLTCSSPRAVSIHAYSPPLWRLGQYTVDPEGALHRLSVSYADELRPLDADALPAAA